MFKKKLLAFFILISLCISVGAFLPVNNVDAQTNLKQKIIDDTNSLQDVGGQIYKGSAGEPTVKVENIVIKVINAVLGLLGVIFLVLIIYAGFLWMTAGGNEEQVTKARKLLINSIIGVVIVVAAYAISYFVINAILP